MLLQAAWILTVPPFRGIDEFDHAFRAAAVARGRVGRGRRCRGRQGQRVTVPRSLVEAAHGQCAALPYTGPENCSPVESVSDGNVTVASSAASYHPAFYWVVGTAALPFDGAASLYAMRIATALLSLTLHRAGSLGGGQAAGHGPGRPDPATTPVFVYSTTIAAPNGVEMSAGMALWGTLLALMHGQKRATESRLLWAAIACAVTLGTLRVLGRSSS